MSTEELIVVVPQPPKNLCPICGKASYSVGGVHPQCAMQQADQPRLARLKAAKAVESKQKKPTPQPWKTKCPKCGAVVHRRRAVCECGHRLGSR